MGNKGKDRMSATAGVGALMIGAGLFLIVFDIVGYVVAGSIVGFGIFLLVLSAITERLDTIIDLLRRLEDKENDKNNTAK